MLAADPPSLSEQHLPFTAICCRKWAVALSRLLLFLLCMGRYLAAEPVPLVWSSDPLIDEPFFALEAAPPPVIGSNLIALARSASLCNFGWCQLNGSRAVYDTRTGELIAGGTINHGSAESPGAYWDS